MYRMKDNNFNFSTCVPEAYGKLLVASVLYKNSFM